MKDGGGVDDEGDVIPRERIAAFEALEQRLRADGYMVRVTCLAVPVQVVRFSDW